MPILSYIIASIMAAILGQVVLHLCKKLPPVVMEEIKYPEFFKSLKHDFKFDYKYTLIQLLLFNLLIWFSGFNLVTFLYFIVIATLLVVFSIDYRFTLIPDEAHIVLVIVGFVNLFANIGNSLDYILGALVGGAIFYILGLLAILIFKKEGMGFGDVKLMAALGFVFGLKNIIVIAMVAFFIGAIVGITLIVIKKQELNGYIPFGPFIVLATILLMFIPADTILTIYVDFCTWLGRGASDLIFNLFYKNQISNY